MAGAFNIGEPAGRAVQVVDFPGAVVLAAAAAVFRAVAEALAAVARVGIGKEAIQDNRLKLCIQKYFPSICSTIKL